MSIENRFYVLGENDESYWLRHELDDDELFVGVMECCALGSASPCTVARAFLLFSPFSMSAQLLSLKCKFFCALRRRMEERSNVRNSQHSAFAVKLSKYNILEITFRDLSTFIGRKEAKLSCETETVETF